jgi:hypothetical protein
MRSIFIKSLFWVLFHFAWNEKGNDPETAEATMEGLAFPSPPSRAAGSEEAGRRSCLSFPANIRKIEAGKRVLRRREGGLGNGVKNPDGEQGRFRIVSQIIFPRMKWKRTLFFGLFLGRLEILKKTGLVKF